MQSETKFLYPDHWSTEELECYLITGNYSSNSRPFIQMMCYDAEMEIWTPYATLTVNIPSAATHGENCTFIDTNNAGFALHLICDYLEIGEVCGVTQSGYCIYPEVRLNPDKLSLYTLNKKEN